MNFVSTVLVFFGGMLFGGVVIQADILAREKKIALAREQLIELSKVLETEAEELSQREKAVRDKWQAMVVDFSKYQAIIDESETNKWTESDDIYLNSWKSAED